MVRGFWTGLCRAMLLGMITAAAAWPAAARQLTIGLAQFPSNLHPNIDSMAAKSFVQGLTMRQITIYDADWKMVCMICVELPTLENGGSRRETAPDGSQGVVNTYTLVPGLSWGDGVPVTTRDVLFTWEVGRHPQSGVSNDELYRRIWQIDIVDERTFRIHDSKLDYVYNGMNDFRLIPEHLERKVFEADPATYRNRTLFDTDPTNPGLAFGPYRIGEHVTGSHIVLERNPLWQGEEPVPERIVVRAIENTSALEAALLAGEIDMIPGEIGLSLDQALALERRQDPRFRVLFKPGLIYEHVDPNLDNPILADIRVRQALMLGMDRETLTQRLFAGRQPVADGPVHPLDWAHDAAVQRWSYDPARAAALLEEAGWRGRPGAIRANAAGEPLRLELISTAGDRTRELVEQVLQSQWRQLGIDVRIQNQPARVLFGETLAQRRFTGLALYAWISSPENLPRSTLHSDQVPRPENAWAGQNVSGYRNPAMDALLDRIETELDRPARKQLWAELQRLYAQDLPSLPLYFRASPYILPAWLDNIVPTGHMAPVTAWVEDWRLAAP